jgi:hypothetical protein
MSTSENKLQIDRFKEAARELDADDDEAVFNAKLRKLVKQQPRPPRPHEKPSDE